MEEFAGYVVLVTGAASGIGRETARQFIGQGAEVIGVDYDEETLGKTKKALGERYLARQCDVSNAGRIEGLSREVKETFGKLDVLVNNAGRAKFLGPVEMEEEDFYYHYDVLVKGPMLFVKHFFPLLKASKNPCIVNISSDAARVEVSNHFLYSTAKAAVEKYTRHLARDLPGIRSNAILPGWIDTPIFGKIGFDREQVEAVFEQVKQRIPSGTIGKPEDIANCILFLCSEKASYINGAAIPVDGAYLCGGDWGT